MNSFSLVTWNVNSIRIRMDLLKYLAETYNPDVVCLQEVKAKKEDFPFDDIKANYADVSERTIIDYLNMFFINTF